MKKTIKKDTNLGYIVQVETWFDEDVGEMYDHVDGYTYLQSNILGSGYDHFVFLNGEPHNPNLGKEVDTFIKTLVTIGVPKDQIIKMRIRP